MKLICIGKNYLKHIHELNSKKEDDPVIFLKPDTSVIQKKQPFFIPEFSSDIHYEVEIILKFNRVGKHIEPKFSKKYFDKEKNYKKLFVIYSLQMESGYINLTH